MAGYGTLGINITANTTALVGEIRSAATQAGTQASTALTATFDTAINRWRDTVTGRLVAASKVAGAQAGAAIVTAMGTPLSKFGSGIGAMLATPVVKAAEEAGAAGGAALAKAVGTQLSQFGPSVETLLAASLTKASEAAGTEAGTALSTAMGKSMEAGLRVIMPAVGAMTGPLLTGELAELQERFDTTFNSISKMWDSLQDRLAHPPELPALPVGPTFAGLQTGASIASQAMANLADTSEITSSLAEAGTESGSAFGLRFRTAIGETMAAGIAAVSSTWTEGMSKAGDLAGAAWSTPFVTGVRNASTLAGAAIIKSLTVEGEEGGTAAGVAAGRAMAAASSAVSGGISGLLAVGKGAATALGAVGLGMAAIGLESFKAAAQVQSMSTALSVVAKNAGLSEQSVNRTVAAVVGQNITWKAATQEVTTFVRANLSLTDAQKLAADAQNFATLANKDSSTTLANLTWGIQTQNERVLRTAGATIQVSQAEAQYAKQLGITTDQLTANQKQQAVLQAVLENGTKVSGAYAASMQDAGKVLTSLPRVFNNIAVGLGQQLLPVLNPIVISFYNMATAFAQAVQQGGVLAPVVNMVAQALKPLADGIVTVMQNTAIWLKTVNTAQIQAFANRVKGTVQPVIALASAFSLFTAGHILNSFTTMLGLDFGKLTGNFGKLGEEVGKGGLASDFEALTNPVGLTVGAIGGLLVASPELRTEIGRLLSSGIGSLPKLFDDIRTSVTKVIQPIKNVAGAVGDSMAGALGSVFGGGGPTSIIPPGQSQAVTQFASGIGSVVRSLASLAKSGLDALPGFFKDILNAVKPLLPPLGELVTTLMQIVTNPLLLTMIKGIAVAFGVTLLGALDVLNPLLRIFAATLQTLSPVIGVVMDVVAAGVGAWLLLGKAFGIVTAAITVLKNAFIIMMMLWDATPIGVITLAIAAVGAAFVVAYNHIKPFRDAVDDLGHALEDLGGVIVKAFGGLWGKITGLVGDAGSWATKNIIDPINKVLGPPGGLGTSGTNAGTALRTGITAGASSPDPSTWTKDSLVDPITKALTASPGGLGDSGMSAGTALRNGIQAGVNTNPNAQLWSKTHISEPITEGLNNSMKSAGQSAGQALRQGIEGTTQTWSPTHTTEPAGPVASQAQSAGSQLWSPTNTTEPANALTQQQGTQNPFYVAGQVSSGYFWDGFVATDTHPNSAAGKAATAGASSLQTEFNKLEHQFPTLRITDLLEHPSEVASDITSWFSKINTTKIGHFAWDQILGLTGGMNITASWFQTNVYDKVQSALEKAGHDFQGFVDSGFNAAVQWGQGVINWQNGISNWLLKNFWDPIGRAFNRAWGKTSQWYDAGNAVLNNFFLGLGASMNQVNTWVTKNIFDPILKWFNGNHNLLNQQGEDIMSGFFAGLVPSNVTKWIEKNVFDPVINGFIGLFQTHSPSRVTASIGSDVIAGFLDGMLSGIAGIAKWIQQHVIDPVVSAFSGAPGRLATQGEDIIGGFLNGMARSMKDIGSWIHNNIYAPVVNYIESFFHISSPSKVMDDLGFNVTAGFMGGLFRGAKNLGGFVTHVFGGMPEALAAFVGRGFVSASHLSSEAMGALQGLIGSGIGWVRGALGSLWDSIAGGGSPATSVAAGNWFANLQAVARYMAQAGWAPAAAAGIAGNVYRESGGNPLAQGTGGRGLIGWTPMSKLPNSAFIPSDPSLSLDRQLPLAAAYFRSALTAYQRNVVNALTSPQLAALAIMNWGERPYGSDPGDPFSYGVSTAAGAVRADMAKQVFSSLYAWFRRMGFKGFASGGVMTEPGFGFGARTGTPFTIAENGPEMISPIRGYSRVTIAPGVASTNPQTRSGQTPVVIHVYPQRGQSEEAIAAAVSRRLGWAAAGGAS